MTKISLRVYNHEIEALIESGQVDEAIAHCKNILKTFPMHLETYRLLGKAFLETRRYSDAADIFQRVLMSVPEDFVSHVGMSIIRDDEKKLDEAIWHMERAFEVQPSNPAIQDELRKLYGRRDGVQPPKVRLTRDALANMYTQGALYSQAIAEIRAVLADDPNRPDLQVMLARAYSRDGRKKQAIEICTELLKNFPYCFDALRILIDLMPTTDQHEFTQTYRFRVKALDPYSEFVSGSIFDSDNVPDAAVNLELLDYDSNDPESGLQPDWASSLGIRLESGDEQQNVPDWLSEKTNETQPVSEEEILPLSMDVETKESSDNEDVPDWMRSSGWEKPTDQTVENAVFDETELENDEPLTRADIPEWLKDLAPDEEILEPDKLPDGFESLLDGNFIKSPLEDNLNVTKNEPGFIEDIIENEISEMEFPHLKDDSENDELIQGVTATTLVSQIMDSDQDVVDNISSGEPLETSKKTSDQPVDDISSWLGEVQQEVKSGENELKSSGDNIDDLPDWLKDMGSETQDDDLNIINKTIADIPNQPIESLSGEDQDGLNSVFYTDEELPEWLKEIDSTQEATTNNAELDSTLGVGSEILSKEDVEKDALNLELNSEPEELVIEEETQTQIDDAIQMRGSVNEGLHSVDEQDEAVAWLEGLESRQGAKSDEMLTKPEDRLEEPSEIVENSIEEEIKSIDEETIFSIPTDPGLVEIGKPDENNSNIEDDTKAKEISEIDEQSQVIDSNDQVEIPEEKVISSIDLDNYPEASVKEDKKNLPEVSPSFLDGQPSNMMDEKSLEDDDEFGLPNDQSPNESSDTETIISPEPDVSEWLKGLDTKDDAVIPDEPIEQKVSENIGSETPEPLPDWLKEMETEASSSEWISESEEPPEPSIESIESELITNEKDIDEKVEIFPTEASKWTFEDTEPDLEPLGEEVKPVDSGEWQPAQPEEQAPPLDIAEISKSETSHPINEFDQVSEPLVTRMLSKIPTKDIEKEAGNLEEAQSFIESGEIKKAIDVYSKLIKKGKLLEGVIHDLRETTNRYPAEIGIWQLLGDAFMRANQLQDALDAYTKAEELLR